MNSPANFSGSADGSTDGSTVAGDGAAGQREAATRQARESQRELDRQHRARERQKAVEQAPFVAVSIQSTGIHPATSRLVAVDVVTYSAAGEPVEEFHAVVNPDSDPGPAHLHGLSPAEIAGGRPFNQILKPLGRLLDDRTLIVHNLPLVWGFLVSESRRVMTAATRSNRSRSRGRGRRRQRVGHVPRPVEIVDTLATARRQSVPLLDTRIRGVARVFGLDAPSPVASVGRASEPESVTSRKSTELVAQLYFTQRERGELATRTPEQLRADRFGLQRTQVRVAAMEAPRPHANPGHYRPGHALAPGMEVVVAPEIELDPDEVITACVSAELAYSEKLTRQTSVVVCNQTRELRGKAMHAHRKGIPLLSDVAFLNAVDRLQAPK